MPRVYGSIEQAQRAFEAYARFDPRLKPLWQMCRNAAPPSLEADFDDDIYDADPFENDVVAADEPTAGWCAEIHFLQNVKPRLMLLAGLHRPGEPHELHSRGAYDAIYDLLLNYALNRSCPCCADRDVGWWPGGDEGGSAHP